ncbi:DUF6095 family protein [Ulvibacter litoralis]|uniref:Uncharacterized protein n=1 Tax=Ulvibacter litoralis TaxID=227084 RepID=A0A1G7EJV6_9FLAO|nr:DUF6095 family protein [Ulvibacter litoralis]GHC54841.1 hypothetical protein GCM10008083_18990 [Ulvibacter litoralis]SDE63715.1 hypothetical protein SAMN05421855_1021 [Ulvibacter litoralis]
MSKGHTNIKTLVRGIKYMAFALPILFLSPYLMSLGFLNKDNISFYIFFPVGIILGILAVYLCFKGIQTIMRSIFND